MVNNVYSLANAELERLHHLLIEAERNGHRQMQQYGISSGASMGMMGPTHYAGLDIREIHQKINEFHKLIFAALKETDAKIQEKVAELALADVQK